MNKRPKSMVYNDLGMIGKYSRYLSYSRVLKNLKVGNWLDLMCGYEANLLWTGKECFGEEEYISEYWGMDLNVNKAKVGSKFKLVEGFIDKKLPFDDESFDNVTIIDGLEHLWNPLEVLIECFRILKSGGVMLVMVPTWFGKPFLEYLAFKLLDKQGKIEINDHKMYYDVKLLWPMLVRAGFVPENIEIRTFKMGCSLFAKVLK